MVFEPVFEPLFSLCRAGLRHGLHPGFVTIGFMNHDQDKPVRSIGYMTESIYSKALQAYMPRFS